MLVSFAKFSRKSNQIIRSEGGFIVSNIRSEIIKKKKWDGIEFEIIFLFNFVNK